MTTTTAEKPFFDLDEDDDEDDLFHTTASDRTRAKSDARQRDAGERQRYEQQIRDEGLDPKTGESQPPPGRPGESRTPDRSGRVRKGLSYARSGARTGSTAAKTFGSDTSRLVQGKRPVSLAAGVLGLLGYAIGVNFLQGGWTQTKGWLGAKFLNKPYTAAAAGTSGAATVTPSSTSAAPTSSTSPPVVLVSDLTSV